VKKIKEQRGELSVRCRDGTGGALAGAGAGAGAGAEPGLRCCRGDFLHFSRSLASCWSPGRFSGVWVREGRGWAWSTELRACESDKRGTSDPEPNLA
jgi:hypothetical protein